MKKSDAFLLNQCLIILAFILSLNGEELLGILSALAAILFSQICLSWRILQKDSVKILVVSFIELLFLELSGLNQMFPSIYFLSLSSLIVSFSWNHAGYKALHYGMQWMKNAGILFGILSLFARYSRFGIGNTVLIVMFIFLPSNFFYCLRQLRYNLDIRRRNEQMSVVE